MSTKGSKFYNGIKVPTSSLAAARNLLLMPDRYMQVCPTGYLCLYKKYYIINLSEFIDTHETQLLPYVTDDPIFHYNPRS